MTNKKFSGRLAIQQRVLPVYRAPFFDTLAASCEGGLSLFAGEPRPIESIATTQKLNIAQYNQAKNRHILSGPLYFCNQENLLQWLEDTNPDALILEANSRYLATPSAIKWMRARNRPVIGWGLGAPQQTGLLAGLRQKNWMRFLNKFDALIAYSQRGAADYASLGIPKDRIFVAHNAVAPKPKGEMLQRPLYKANEPLIILFVGRLQARKRLDNLINAIEKIPEEHMLRLWIVGDGPERKSLEKQAALLNSEKIERIRFFGERHGAELNHIWAESDIFVLPGTGGLAVQEAMSHALPVIVAKGDGTQNDLVRPENGWQIPPDDLSALITTLKNAVSDIHRLRAMGAESWRIVSEEVNIEKMAETFLRCIEKAA
ncbi:MAG: glycosyltransferase family 4 protein [Chloroflexi bacterium]|nr:glycosyltransferase family 4 protein [Chloroflexota bacterium]